ncbi:MAG: hypothetical protein AB1705_16225 [Verrucomicrobiota bacterium]
MTLRTALACLLPDADISYSRLNALVGVDHQSRKIGEGRGLGPGDIEKVLSSLGVHYDKIIHEPRLQLQLPTDFQRDLYGFIESGCPALLGFELDEPNPGPDGGSRHIIPVLGHTFNEDTWVPDAMRDYFGDQLSYFSSESWLSTYVIHDDNFGPYYCLPRHFLKKDNFRVIFGLKPQPTSFSAVEAEAVGFDFLKAVAARIPALRQDWYDRFAVFQRCGLLVLRTTLVRHADYVAHLRALRSWEGVPLEESHVAGLDKSLPGYFWMIEASAPELFSASRRKFGEILLSATAPLPKRLDLSLFLAARLPGLLLLNNGRVVVAQSQLQGHTALFSLT